MSSAEPLFDPDRLAAIRRRATAIAKADAGFLLEHAAGELADRLAATNRHFVHGLDVLTPGPGLAPFLAGAAPQLRLERIGTADAAKRHGDRSSRGGAPSDLAVSAFGLHWLDDLPGALAAIRATLKPDGLFMAALPAEGTLAELRDALIAAEEELSGGAGQRVDPFVELRQAGALLQQAGFALPVADLDKLVVRYDRVADLVADLRAMGATSALSGNRRRLPRGIMDRLEAIYAERHADPDGRIRASFNFAYLTGWAPHESQQKPLRPGSGTVSLAEVLGRRPGSS